MCAEQHERLAHERRQVNDLLVGDQIELIEDGVVLDQVLVLDGLLAATEDATRRHQVVLARILNGLMSDAPLLQLRTGYEAGRGHRRRAPTRTMCCCRCGRRRRRRGCRGRVARQRARHALVHDALRLPPVVVVLARDLQDVADLEANARLWTRHELVTRRLVVEQTLDVDLLCVCVCVFCKYISRVSSYCNLFKLTQKMYLACKWLVSIARHNLERDAASYFSLQASKNKHEQLTA